MLLCAHCPLIASTIPLNSSLRYTEIIASDNGSSTLHKHVFFPFRARSLLHWVRQRSAPNNHLTSLNYLCPFSLSHSPFALNLSGPLSHCLLPHCAYHTKGGAVKLVFTHSVLNYIFISRLLVQVRCLFALMLSKSIFFPHPSVILSQTVSVCPFWYVSVLGQCAQGLARRGAAPLWTRASAFRHAALWAMINLRELSRCLSSTELWAGWELGDSRATSGRQLHSLITERPG